MKRALMKIVVGILAWAALGLFAAIRSEAAEVVPVRWVKVQGMAQFEVRDGVCVVYAPVTSTRRGDDRVPLEPLVQGCIEKGGLVPGAGEYDLVWYHTSDGGEVIQLFKEWYNPSKRKLMGFPDGVFKREGSTCKVASLRGTATLGHEMLHCEIGHWHL